LDTPLVTLNLLSARSSQEPRGTIAVPIRDHVNAATVMSLLHTDWRFLGADVLDRVIIQGSILTMQRNEAVQRMRGEYLLFIDDDMVWEPAAVGQLVQAWQGLRASVDGPVIVGGLCFRRSPPYQPTLYMRERPTSGPYSFLEKWNGVVEVDATGCAFLLIPVDALEAIAGTSMPSYEERQKMTGLPDFFRWEKTLGEDLRFCQDAKAAGVRIFVDTEIQVGHVAEITVGHNEFLQSVATRSPELQAQRKVVNDRLGLPTLTSEEARRELGW
jgi:hypothetical protein